eukprot:497699-Prymnesium_polylepis.1
MLVVWPYDDVEEEPEEAKRAVVSASRCALELLRLNGSQLWNVGGDAVLTADLATAEASERESSSAVEEARKAAER